MSWNNGNRPFLLSPAAKDYLWGGTRLNDDFNLGVDIYPFAEAWVCSTHPDGESCLTSSFASSLASDRTSGFTSSLASNRTSGFTSTKLTLSEALREHPEWLGTHVLAITEGRAELPILIKLIDAKSDLSVQVHPDDEYAARVEGQWGKTEMWYVLAARPGAELVYGFNRNVDKDVVREAVENGTIGSLLNHVPVHKDDLFFIESGTVHAIGAGCLIAEIQQSSNLTYRLYDYDRTDKDGRKRELHVGKALDVVKMENSAAPRQPMRVLKYKNGCASELLTRCKYFQVERLLLNTEGRKLADFQTGENSFHALLCVDGCGVLFGKDYMLNYFKGDCIFVPADSIPLKLHGKAQLLNISC